MRATIHQVFLFLFHHGAWGLVLLGIFDSSFLFLPIGNDLLLIALVAQNHSNFLIDVLAAATGSAIGVFLLDLVCRKGGEEGLGRLMSPQRLSYLKKKMEERAAIMVAAAALAPPPFPFTATIAAASALQYPRVRLISLVFGARLVRFALIGLAAIWLKRDILRIAKSTEFTTIMEVFTAVCILGSIYSVYHWVRPGRLRRSTA